MIEKRPYGFLCLLLCLIVCTALIGCSSDRGQKQGRETILFDSEWRFCKGDVENAEDPAYDDSKWRNLNLPHDWSIESTFSNCDTIELLINGKSLGTKALADFDDRMITWKNVPYQTGTINA